MIRNDDEGVQEDAEVKREPLMVKSSAEKSGLPPIAAISGVMKEETQRGHERAERGADHDGDRKLDDVAPQHEVAEFLDHRRMLAAPMDDATNLHCLIEIPKGSRNKYEWDPELQAIKLNRFLFSSVHYPTDYGFITDTIGPHGDALDALVCVSAATFPGCLIEVRPVGVLRMTDEEGQSDKLVCVPTDDPAWEEVEELGDMLEPAAHRDRALLLDVQGAGGQARRHPGLGRRGRRRRGDREGPQAYQEENP